MKPQQPQQMKQAVLEPQIYAIILKSDKGSVLHLGIHFSLDDAIAAATPTLLNSYKHEQYENISVDMWAMLTGSDVIRAMTRSTEQRDETLLQPTKTPEEYVQTIKKQKNLLIKKIIDTKDLNTITRYPKMFTQTEKKYMTNKIKELMAIK